MQQPAGNSATATPPTQAQDPMNGMMQQMMTNPAMMQQAQQMMSNPAMMQQMAQMFGGMGGMGGNGFGGTPPSATPDVSAAPVPQSGPGVTAAPFMNPLGFGQASQNPLQQMMSNPALMQMMGNMGGQMGANPMGPASQPVDGDAMGNGGNGANAIFRMRYAPQLAQLAAMGFTDENLCLQALQRCNGRVDAALDSLLSS